MAEMKDSPVDTYFELIYERNEDNKHAFLALLDIIAELEEANEKLESKVSDLEVELSCLQDELKVIQKEN